MTEQATKHVVGFLGLGNLRRAKAGGYERTLYRDPATDEAIEAYNAPHYLAQRYGLERIHLLVTWQVEVSGSTEASALDELRTVLTALDPPCEVVAHRIPLGRDSDELWQVFEVLRTVIQDHGGHPVILDVSHGFRHAPMLALSVAQYLEALPEGAPVIERVHYAALDMRGARDEGEAQELGLAPVLDLAPLLELQRWTRDVVVLEQTGRTAPLGDRLKALADEIGRRAGAGAWTPRDSQTLKGLRGVAGSLLALDGDLLSLRLQHAAGPRGSAARIAQRLAATGIEQVVARHAPPLAPLLQHISSSVAPIAADDRVELARWYLRNGHVVQAISVAFEELTTLALVSLGREDRSFDSDSREAVERALRAASDADTTHGAGSAAVLSEMASSPSWPRFQRLGSLRRNFADLRNDVMHSSYRPKPGTAKSVRARAESLVAALVSLRQAPTAAAPTPPAGPGAH